MTPCSTTSTMPPLRVATTGTPQAIAGVADSLPASFPRDLASAVFDGLMQAAEKLGH